MVVASKYLDENSFPSSALKDSPELENEASALG